MKICAIIYIKKQLNSLDKVDKIPWLEELCKNSGSYIYGESSDTRNNNIMGDTNVDEKTTIILLKTIVHLNLIRLLTDLTFM